MILVVVGKMQPKQKNTIERENLAGDEKKHLWHGDQIISAIKQL